MLSLYKFVFKILRRVRVRNTYEMDWTSISGMLKQHKTVKNIILWDGKYKYTDFATMMKIIKYDIVKWNDYRSEVFDCDNFAVSFAGMVPFIYGINNVGIAIGKVIDEKGNVGYHAWNVFLARKSDGNPMLYMYEPQSGKFSTYREGRIGNWKYEPIYVIWG